MNRLFSNRLFTTGLSVLLLTGTNLPSALANSVAAQPRSVTANLPTQISPFNLAYLAYQGQLEEAGIPKASGLLHRTQSGSITATDLIKAAIQTGRLSSDSLTNPAYIAAVQYELERLRTS